MNLCIFLPLATVQLAGPRFPELGRNPGPWPSKHRALTAGPPGDSLAWAFLCLSFIVCRMGAPLRAAARVKLQSGWKFRERVPGTGGAQQMSWEHRPGVTQGYSPSLNPAHALLPPRPPPPLPPSRQIPSGSQNISTQGCICLEGTEFRGRNSGRGNDGWVRVFCLPGWVQRGRPRSDANPWAPG